MYSYHLFLISSASVGSLPLLSFTVSIFAWNVPLVSLIYLKRSLVFPVLLFSSISFHWGRLSYLSLLFLGTLYSNGFISVLAFAKGGTFIVGLPLPTRPPSGPKEWQGDREHLPIGQASLCVHCSINQSCIMWEGKLDTGPVCPEAYKLSSRELGRSDLRFLRPTRTEDSWISSLVLKTPPPVFKWCLVARRHS